MYICNNCKSLFEYTVSIREYHNELDDRPYEELEVCPYCKSDDVDIAAQCSLCGEYVTCDYVKLSDGTVACLNCYQMY